MVGTPHFARPTSLVQMVEKFEMSDVTIYMPLQLEGTDVWRPVQATCIAEGQYRIVGHVPAHESWTFQPGSVVRCENKVFDGGQTGLVPVANVKP
jgi:hypothetical protein